MTTASGDDDPDHRPAHQRVGLPCRHHMQPGIQREDHVQVSQAHAGEVGAMV